MELSKGFQALSSKAIKFGLLPSQAVIHRVLYPETEYIDEFSQACDHDSELVDEVVELDAIELEEDNLPFENEVDEYVDDENDYLNDDILGEK